MIGYDFYHKVEFGYTCYIEFSNNFTILLHLKFYIKSIAE